MARYTEHYDTQLGGGGMENFYRGAPYQRGHGIGSFLGGLFRRVLPLLTSGARAVGKEALRTGMHVMADMENNVPFKESIKARAKESGLELKRKAQDKIANLMKGSGYKTATTGQGRQLMLARLNRLVGAGTSRKTGKVNQRRKNSAKKKNKKKKKTAGAIRNVSGKGGKRKKSSKKRAVTDIFGPV